MTNLTFSELLYLNAEKYVTESSFLQFKEELPSGQKVNVNKVGDLVAEAAFAYLFINNHINLELQTKKSLGIFSKQVVVATKKSDGGNLTSLEKAIFDKSESMDAGSIMNRVIGNECSSPWGVITEIVKKSLVEKDYLTKEEIVKKILVKFTTYKYHSNPAKNVDLSADVAEMNGKLKEFSQKDFYKLLIKQIDSGIASQKEQPDTSSD